MQSNDPTTADDEMRKLIRDLKLDYYELLHKHGYADFKLNEQKESEGYSKDESQLEDLYAKAFAKLLTTHKQRACIEELKNLMFRHTRTYTQTVTDREGNVYVDDSHSYISKYETQERIAQLEAQLTHNPKSEEAV